MEKQQLNLFTPRILIPIPRNLTARLDLDSEFFAQLARQRPAGRLTLLDLAARELPFTRVILVVPAAANENPPAAFDQRGNNPRHINKGTGNLSDTPGVQLQPRRKTGPGESRG